ncbi:MAG TPA: hypothetical protein VGX03_03090 [Candidatus Binatia bacterium]|nr:hypothetical protein [Candidatus Binatia bacterium]
MSRVVVQGDTRAPKPSGKAEGLQCPEGSSPEDAKPSGWDTTGV